jgi:hypothetical protein
MQNLDKSHAVSYFWHSHNFYLLFFAPLLVLLPGFSTQFMILFFAQKSILQNLQIIFIKKFKNYNLYILERLVGLEFL